MKKNNTIKICVSLNFMQILLSCVAAGLNAFDLLGDIIVRTSVFALQISVWILLTMYLFMKYDVKNKADGLKVGLTAVLPAVILTVIAALMGHFSDSGSASWLSFAFFGSAISFYNKPAIILSNYIHIADAYLIFCANYFMLMLCSCIGGFMGALSNISIEKKKQKNLQQENKDTMSVTMALEQLEEIEDETEGIIETEEDEALSEVVLDEVYDEEDESTTATVISIPTEDDDEEGTESDEEETVQEAVSIISVDVDELEDEAEDLFKKRYDEMSSDEEISEESETQLTMNEEFIFGVDDDEDDEEIESVIEEVAEEESVPEEIITEEDIQPEIPEINPEDTLEKLKKAEITEEDEKSLQEMLQRANKKKQRDKDFDNWVNRRTTRVDTNEIREALKNAGYDEE